MRLDNCELINLLATRSCSRHRRIRTIVWGQCPCDDTTHFSPILFAAEKKIFGRYSVAGVRSIDGKLIYCLHILHAIFNRFYSKRFELVNDARHCIGSIHSGPTAKSHFTWFFPFTSHFRIFAQSTKFLFFSCNFFYEFCMCVCVCVLVRVFF